VTRPSLSPLLVPPLVYPGILTEAPGGDGLPPDLCGGASPGCKYCAHRRSIETHGMVASDPA